MLVRQRRPASRGDAPASPHLAPPARPALQPGMNGPHAPRRPRPRTARRQGYRAGGRLSPSALSFGSTRFLLLFHAGGGGGGRAGERARECVRGAASLSPSRRLSRRRRALGASPPRWCRGVRSGPGGGGGGQRPGGEVGEGGSPATPLRRCGLRPLERRGARLASGGGGGGETEGSLRGSAKEGVRV